MFSSSRWPVALILFAALSRMLPHPANMVPITAIALFAGVYLDKKLTFIVPIAAMLISDYFIGFYSGIEWTYASFLAIGVIGLWLRSHKTPVTILGSSIAGSVLFFVITNFGVLISNQVSYTHNFAGLLACYTAAIPFFRYSVNVCHMVSSASSTHESCHLSGGMTGVPRADIECGEWRNFAIPSPGRSPS